MESLCELYRIGLGPSSSHTMGPAKAAEIYLGRHPGAKAFEVTLYGSLAATGVGHFTDRALAQVLGADRTTIRWNGQETLGDHPNGMKFTADGADEWIVFSVGGGALREAGGRRMVHDVYPYTGMADILARCEATGAPLWQLVEEAEGEKITAYMEEVLKTMYAAIDAGLKRDGVLPGGMRLQRRARSIYQKSRFLQPEFRRTGLVAAYATAVREENAALGTVVTAPTCGSAGVLPGVGFRCPGAGACAGDRRALRQRGQAQRLDIRRGSRLPGRGGRGVRNGRRRRRVSLRGNRPAVRDGGGDRA